MQTDTDAVRSKEQEKTKFNSDLYQFLNDRKQNLIEKNFISTLLRLSDLINTYDIVLAGSTALQLQVIAQIDTICLLPLEQTQFIFQGMAYLPQDIDLRVLYEHSLLIKQLNKKGMRLNERFGNTLYLGDDNFVSINISSFNGNQCLIGISEGCDIPCDSIETIKKGKELRQKEYGVESRFQRISRERSHTKDTYSAEFINNLIQLSRLESGPKFNLGGDIY